MLENLIQEFTTAAVWVTPKDYYLMRLEQLKEVSYKFNGQDCIMFVELHQVVYEGRKRKNITEYGQVITIDICDKNNNGINEFQPLKLVSKDQHTFKNGYDEIIESK